MADGDRWLKPFGQGVGTDLHHLTGTEAAWVAVTHPGRVRGSVGAWSGLALGIGRGLAAGDRSAAGVADADEAERQT